jgi:hypothetical protein
MKIKKAGITRQFKEAEIPGKVRKGDATIKIAEW